jgi:hypothetical protein
MAGARGVASVASVLASVLWIVAWAHLLMAHGTTEVNEARIVLGLTWLDSGRLIAPSLVLVGVAIVAFARGARQPSVSATAIVALIGVAVAATGIVLGFWTQPWGTYVGASRESGVAAIGGAVVIVGSLLLAVGIVAFAIAAARARVLPVWLALLVAVGAITTVPWLYEAPQGIGFGVAWLVVGLYLAVRGPEGEGSPAADAP